MITHFSLISMLMYCLAHRLYLSSFCTGGIIRTLPADVGSQLR